MSAFIDSIDLLITNATVVDGSGQPGRRADVAVRGERIMAIGSLVERVTTGRTIDGHGLVLAPGFIDVHTHDDFALLAFPEMDFKVMQGVTTCIVGNCGFGAAPFAPAAEFAQSLCPSLVLPVWQGYTGYMQTLSTHPASVNAAVLVGHNLIRRAVMGNAHCKPTKQELKQMADIVEEGFHAGAVGFSSGLIYEPGRYSQTEELIYLANIAAQSGGLYTTHLRNEADQLTEAVEEALTIGETARIAVQISHHKAAGKNNWGRVRQTLQRIQKARQEGMMVAVDQYPYVSASTLLSEVLSMSALNKKNSYTSGVGYVEASNVVIASAPKHPEWVGHTLQHFCEQWKVEAETAAKRLLQDDQLFVIIYIMCEEDVCTVLQHPLTMIGSDGVPTEGGQPHPRLYGTFARVLGHYVREKRLLSLEEAIYRMTVFPANQFKLRDRGIIREGAFADIVLLNPQSIADKATYEHPRQYPQGIEYVLVNGTVVVNQGVHTHARPGQVLRHHV